MGWEKPVLVPLRSLRFSYLCEENIWVRWVRRGAWTPQQKCTLIQMFFVLLPILISDYLFHRIVHLTIFSRLDTVNLFLVGGLALTLALDIFSVLFRPFSLSASSCCNLALSPLNVTSSSLLRGETSLPNPVYKSFNSAGLLAWAPASAKAVSVKYHLFGLLVAEHSAVFLQENNWLTLSGSEQCETSVRDEFPIK